MSPLTTRAEKEKRRPPLTTFGAAVDEHNLFSQLGTFFNRSFSLGATASVTARATGRVHSDRHDGDRGGRGSRDRQVRFAALGREQELPWQEQCFPFRYSFRESFN